MNMFKRIGVAALVAFGLTGYANAAAERIGGWMSGKLVASTGTPFLGATDTSTSDWLPSGAVFNKNSMYVGEVIVLEGWGTITSVNATPTLNFGVVLGNTAMIASGTDIAVTAGTWHVKAMGVVTGVGASGTIRWAMRVYADQSSDVEKLYVDTTLDAVDTTIDAQALGLRFIWSASNASNIYTGQSLFVWAY